MIEHFTLVGLARARARWFRDVSRWASSAALPIELVKCVSAEEVRARLEGGGAYSAFLVDAGLPDLDRDLVDRARSVGCPVVAVDDGSRARDWEALHVSAVLVDPVDRNALLAILRQHARPSLGGDAAGTATSSGEAEIGRLVAVTGQRGWAASVVAAALAQGVAREGSTVLADLSLDAQQALAHDAGDVVPGVSELVDAHRSGGLDQDAVRDLTFALDSRPYRLLAGLRRHRDWAALRPRATEAAVRSLRGAFAFVVAEVSPDLEGEDECGSVDVEERNHLARCASGQADVVVCTAASHALGIDALVRVMDGVAQLGVDAGRVLPVLVGAPRPGLERMGLARDVVRLSAVRPPGGHPGARPAHPLFLSWRRDPAALMSDPRGLPASIEEPVTTAVSKLLDRLGPAPSAPAVAIRPGTLGSW